MSVAVEEQMPIQAVQHKNLPSKAEIQHTCPSDAGHL